MQIRADAIRDTAAAASHIGLTQQRSKERSAGCALTGCMQGRGSTSGPALEWSATTFSPPPSISCFAIMKLGLRNLRTHLGILENELLHRNKVDYEVNETNAPAAAN